jgi:glycosyltransferase involved in cell wall biosynthesis
VRVMFVVTHLGLGGAEVQVVDLCSHLVARGHHVTLVSLMDPSALTDRLDALGVRWTSLGAARGRYTPALVTGLRRLVREHRPDVVHSHTFPANLTARLVRATTRRVGRLVTSCHSINEGGPARMAAYRLTDRLTDVTTNCSVAAVERYVEIGAAPADRIVYVPNGIDTARFAPDPAVRERVRRDLSAGDRFVWLAVGRFMEAKDWPNLFAALPAALGPDDEVWVVGGGELEELVLAEAQRAGPRVRVLGVRRDVVDLMKAADAYVMSSAWEGLPIVLLEAAASALPIVATDVGGNHQLVRDGVTGRLVPSRDPVALGTAMAGLRARTATERRAMGAAGREHVAASFGLSAVVDRWLSLYRGEPVRPLTV